MIQDFTYYKIRFLFHLQYTLMMHFYDSPILVCVTLRRIRWSNQLTKPMLWLEEEMDSYFLSDLFLNLQRNTKINLISMTEFESRFY